MVARIASGARPPMMRATPPPASHLLDLLRSRRFLPLFLAQSLGALVDNLYRNALVVLVIFRDPAGGAPLVALAAGIFILPYVLFSAPAGQLADRHDKAMLIRLTKITELVLMLVAGAALLSGSPTAMLLVLFGLGTQATFFGPLKYAILPDHLAPADLVAGNALVEAGTFAAILLGTIAGSWLAGGAQGPAWAAGAGVALSALGLLASRAIPAAPPDPTAKRLDPNVPRATWHLVRHALTRRSLRLCVLGISWFWTLGAILLAQLPVVAARILQADNRVVSLLVGMFTVGIGAGSLLAGRLARDSAKSPARHVGWAALGLSLAALDFAWACHQASPRDGLHDIGHLLSAAAGWRMLIDLLLVAGCGGVFSVPLYALLQSRAEPGERAAMVAANNVVNAVGIVAGSALVAVLPVAGVGPPGIIALVALANLAVGGWLARARPG
jgi:MFS family permease